MMINVVIKPITPHSSPIQKVRICQRKMGLDPGALDFVQLYIIDDDTCKAGNPAQEKRQRLKNVDGNGQIS